MSFIIWHSLALLTSLALAFTMGYYTAKRKKVNG